MFEKPGQFMPRECRGVSLPHGVIERNLPSDMIRGFVAVRVRERVKIQDYGPGSDSIRTEKALAKGAPQASVLSNYKLDIKGNSGF